MRKNKFNSPVWILPFALLQFLVLGSVMVLGANSSSEPFSRVLWAVVGILNQPYKLIGDNIPYLSGYNMFLIMLVANALVWGFAVWLTIKLVYKRNRTLNRIVLFGLLLVSLIFGTRFVFQRTIPSSIQDSPREEIAFIDFFLESHFRDAVTNGVPLVIDKTLSLKGITSNRDIDELKKSLIQSQHRKKIKEAIRDLFRKNTSDCDLSIIGSPSLNHATISVSDFFSNSRTKEEDGWAIFYKKFPDSPGTIKLSRVGFSRDGSVAVVYLGNQRHWLAGSGRLRAYEKIDAQWEVMRFFNCGPQWISKFQCQPEASAYRFAQGDA